MIRVGIFFGGNSREREVSFSGGRTVYDNLDKSLFEAVPYFIDSFNNVVRLDWAYVYKGSIRDFYPIIGSLPSSPNGFQVYAESLEVEKELNQNLFEGIGTQVSLEQLRQEIDFAFLALHGRFAEDGTIQGLMEWLNIPYSGSGIFSSAFGMNKALQKRLFSGFGLAGPYWVSIKRSDWIEHPDKIIEGLRDAPFPLMFKAANQGSSIGLSKVNVWDVHELRKAVNKAFFRVELEGADWISLSDSERVALVREWNDIRHGLGMPIYVDGKKLMHPEELLEWLNQESAIGKRWVLESEDEESEVIAEGFIKGREFSCIVIEGLDGKPLALPPTEIVKSTDLFDYRSKYLPGLSRKVTPIDLPYAEIEKIRQACCELYSTFSFQVYARIDGFYTQDGEVFLNDPNTTSGMMPSSFFFHQAAEIGLSPSAFLTYIIETSVKQRAKTAAGKQNSKVLLAKLEGLHDTSFENSQKRRVAVIMGGYSSERHISVESGRNVFEKLASSVEFIPFPVFLTGNDEAYQLFRIPINMMLKDNADDIKEKLLHYSKHPILSRIQEEAEPIRARYIKSDLVLEPEPVSLEQLAELADVVFIALHGRPGEDGSLQKDLEKVGLPYNGSGVESSSLTINKYLTNRKLEEAGFLVARAILVDQKTWRERPQQVMDDVIAVCKLPLIAKPADDGCSSAVKKIRSKEELSAFAELLFRADVRLPTEATRLLQIDAREEIPQKTYFLCEELIQGNEADHFLEITGGLLTHLKNGLVEYEIFEASEALAEGGILSLEEKFLAGQGQNITPARYHHHPLLRDEYSKQVKHQFLAAAQLLQIEGYARIDAFVRIYEELKKAEVIFIEVNSLPGMTPATCIFHQTAIQGYQPSEFIKRILDFAWEKKRYHQHQNEKHV